MWPLHSEPLQISSRKWETLACRVSGLCSYPCNKYAQYLKAKLLKALLCLPAAQALPDSHQVVYTGILEAFMVINSCLLRMKLPQRMNIIRFILCFNIIIFLLRTVNLTTAKGKSLHVWMVTVGVVMV